MNTYQTSKFSRALKWLAVAGAMAGLTACGSGGGGGGSSTQLTIRGTAATGAAMSGAIVVANCVSGTGNAVANTDGSYTVTITNGKGPCVLTATQGSLVLRSVASGPGTFNITPLTDLLVEYLATRAGTSPANLLSSPNGQAILGDNNALVAAQNAVVDFIRTTYGVNISTANFLTATLSTPQSGAQSPADRDLDLLKAANVITASGAPNPAVIQSVKTEAQKAPPYVAPTGGQS